jgi:hypothetical protein
VPAQRLMRSAAAEHPVPLQHAIMHSCHRSGVLPSRLCVASAAACPVNSLFLVSVLSQWLEYFLAYCGALAFEGDPIEWAKNHTCEWCAARGAVGVDACHNECNECSTA